MEHQVADVLPVQSRDPALVLGDPTVVVVDHRHRLAADALDVVRVRGPGEVAEEAGVRCTGTPQRDAGWHCRPRWRGHVSGSSSAVPPRGSSRRRTPSELIRTGTPQSCWCIRQAAPSPSWCRTTRPARRRAGHRTRRPRRDAARGSDPCRARRLRRAAPAGWTRRAGWCWAEPLVELLPRRRGEHDVELEVPSDDVNARAWWGRTRSPSADGRRHRQPVLRRLHGDRRRRSRPAPTPRPDRRRAW